MSSPLAALDTTHLLALAAALGWASGMRLYAVVLITGLAGVAGWVTLPAGLQVLQHPVVLGVAGLMFVAEFFADKIPALDTLWDLAHTFIRIPAGAALAAAVFGGDSAAWTTAAALLGGSLAATAHVAKATTRAAANTSPEPFSNIGLSLLGDLAVPGLLWLAWQHPGWFFVVLALGIALALVLTVLLFKFLRGLWRRLRGSASPAPRLPTALVLPWASALALLLGGAGAAGLLLPPPAAAQSVAATPTPAAPAPAPERISADLREEIRRLDVEVADAYGRRETVAATLTLYRPPGDGPFPLALVAHGRPTEQRVLMARARFESLARYLVAKGFAVLVPTRAGYGPGATEFDPEGSGRCDQKRYQPMAAAAAEQLLAAVRQVAAEPWADTSRWIVLGQSVGGTAAMAVAARAPQGLQAAVNFSGGAGGNPVRSPGEPCGPQQLQRLWRAQAATATLPVLWVYWRHDRFWGERHPRDWAQAWRDGGGQVDFHQLEPWSADPVDGHEGLLRDMDHALPLLEAHLQRAGFTRPGLIERPPASGYATLDEVDKLPLPAARRERALARYRAAPAPKALALSPRGHYGFASGDWRLGRALGSCQHFAGQACTLYAVDDEVVWPAPASRP